MSLYGRTDSNTNKTKAGRGLAARSITPTVVFVDETESKLEQNRLRGIDGPGWWSYYSYTDSSGKTRHKAEKLVALGNPDLNANETQSDDTIAADASYVITISGQPSQDYAFAPFGGITGLTYPAADALRVEGTYAISADDYTTDGDGTGAEFTVNVDGTGAVSVSFVTSNTSGGQGFAIGDTITISDALLGDGGAADVVLTVSAIAEATATFSVTASVTGGGSLIYQWQTQAPSGTRWTNISGATSSSLVLEDLTFSDEGKKYRVKITSSNGATEVISEPATLLVRSASWYWND